MLCSMQNADTKRKYACSTAAMIANSNHLVSQFPVGSDQVEVTVEDILLGLAVQAMMAIMFLI